MLEGIQSAIDQVSSAVNEELAVVAGIEQSTRLLAVVEAAYIVSAADGVLSEAETQKITQGIRAIAEGVTTDEQVQTMLEIAADRIKGEGVQARADAVAEVIQDPELRRAAFMVAAAASWLDRGIGVKQGLALQAVSKAFDIPMNEMHKLLGQAKQR
jgi:hypothetical protein